MLKVSISFIVLIFFAGATSANNNVENIINKYYDARGGKENIENIQSIKISADLTHFSADFTGGKKNAKFTYYSKGNDKYRLEVEEDGIIEIISATNGKNSWTSTKGGYGFVRGLFELLFALQIRGPFLLDSYLGTLNFSDGSKVIEDGRELHKIKMSTANINEDESFYSYIDATNFLLYKVETDTVADKGFELLFMSDDYKEFDGIFFPMKIGIRSDLTKFVLRVKELKLNQEIDDAIFEKPEE